MNGGSCRKKLNPVDAATHSQLKEEAVPNSWLESSSFLLEQLSAWPMDSPWMAEKEEMRSARLNIADSQAILVQLDISPNNVSRATSSDPVRRETLHPNHNYAVKRHIRKRADA